MKEKIFSLFIGITMVAAQAPSASEYLRAKAAITNMVENDQDLPRCVRLAFHDCVGEDGCNGCINLNDQDNSGLQGIVGRLGNLRQNQGFSAISNADFWQIAGIAALERANSDVELTFRGGRQDCATSPTTDAQDNFPSPNFSGEEMFAWFEEEFDMSPEEATALMGAHSLGRARRGNSGYNGQWTPGRTNVFDNEFYSLLVAPDIVYQNVANDPNDPEDAKWQWNLIGGGFGRGGGRGGRGRGGRRSLSIEEESIKLEGRQRGGGGRGPLRGQD